MIIKEKKDTFWYHLFTFLFAVFVLALIALTVVMSYRSPGYKWLTDACECEKR